MGSLYEGQGGEIREWNKEREWMKEGVWLKEEESLEMVESLMETEAYLKEEIVQVKTTKMPHFHSDDISSVLEFLDNEDAVKSVTVIEEDEKADNNCGTNGEFVKLTGSDKWWEVNSVTSVGDDIWAYDWSFEDDMKMWELVSYPCTTTDFPWNIELWD